MALHLSLFQLELALVQQSLVHLKLQFLIRQLMLLLPVLFVKMVENLQVQFVLLEQKLLFVLFVVTHLDQLLAVQVLLNFVVLS